MNTPVILLDVDGALSADAMSSPEQHGYVKHRFEQGTAVLKRHRRPTVSARCASAEN